MKWLMFLLLFSATMFAQSFPPAPEASLDPRVRSVVERFGRWPEPHPYPGDLATTARKVIQACDVFGRQFSPEPESTITYFSLGRDNTPWAFVAIEDANPARSDLGTRLLCFVKVNLRTDKITVLADEQ